MPRVLVIEDDPSQLDIYRNLLYYNGFDVDTALTAELGLRHALEYTPDVIIMDVMLPGMNGLAAASALKDSPTTAKVPIICMSAYDIDIHRVRRSGADDYLKKPVSGDVLVRTIRRFIGWRDIEVPPID